MGSRVHSGGRRGVLGDIPQPEVITAILTALKLPTEAPAIARARDPEDQTGGALTTASASGRSGSKTSQ